MTKFVSNETLDNWFAYHAPSSPEIVTAHTRVRTEFRHLAIVLNGLLPEGPDKTAALRALRESMYQANACIAVAQDVYREEHVDDKGEDDH